jgi:hypothetical protein
MLPYIFFIGCVFNAPDRSSLRGYDGVLTADYRLKILIYSIGRTRSFSLPTFCVVIANTFFLHLQIVSSSFVE